MFDRDRQPIVDWLNAKFAKAPELAERTSRASMPAMPMARRSRSAAVHKHHIDAAPAEPGLYRTVTGAESLALGLVAGASSPA
jgi:2-oxoglutarate ferredoxin oxidoreductase subunit alpha